MIGVNRGHIAQAASGNGLLTGLISYYTFDTANTSGWTLSDVHGSNDMSYKNTPTKGNTGLLNESTGFNGTNEYGDLGDIAAMDGISDFSINFWFKDSSAGSGQVFIAKYDSAPGSWEISHNSTDYIWRTWNASGTNDFLLTSHSGDFDGNWHMITVTYSDGDKEIFVDGSSVATSSPYTGNLNTTTHPINFARRSYSGAELYFSGDLDECGIWSKALNSDDVSALYNGGSGLSYSSFTS